MANTFVSTLFVVTDKPFGDGSDHACSLTESFHSTIKIMGVRSDVEVGNEDLTDNARPRCSGNRNAMIAQKNFEV